MGGLVLRADSIVIQRSLSGTYLLFTQQQSNYTPYFLSLNLVLELERDNIKWQKQLNKKPEVYRED